VLDDPGLDFLFLERKLFIMALIVHIWLSTPRSLAEFNASLMQGSFLSISTHGDPKTGGMSAIVPLSHTHTNKRSRRVYSNLGMCGLRSLWLRRG